MSPQDDARARALQRALQQSYATDQCRMMREYFALMLKEFRECNDDATPEMVTKNQGAILFCKEVMAALTPTESEREAPDWRPTVQDIAAPSAAY